MANLRIKRNDPRSRLAILVLAGILAIALAVAAFSGAFEPRSGPKVAGGEIETLARAFITSFLGGEDRTFLEHLTAELRATPALHAAHADREHARIGRLLEITLKTGRFSTAGLGSSSAEATFLVKGEKGTKEVALSFAKSGERWRISRYGIEPR